MSDGTPFVIVTTTVDSERAAHAIANALLMPRLVACVQFAPIRSVFWWQGSLEQATEIRLQAKAPEGNVTAILATVEALHPYEVPEIVVTPILTGHPPYLDWIGAETRPPEPPPPPDEPAP